MAGFDDFNRAIRGYQESRILLSALELDLFSAVGGGAPAPTVAARCGADPGATEKLLNALVALGYLELAEKRYHNTALTTRYLTADSPDDARAPLRHNLSLWETWSTLTEAVRTGHSVPRRDMGEREDDWTVPFIAAMHRNATVRAPLVVQAVGAAAVTRMLDVGGGSGAYSIAFAQANPTLRAVVLDLPTVLPITESHIAEAGLSARVSTQAGDLRTDDLGRGYDLVFLSAVCHMLGSDDNRDLLTRSARALSPHGRVVVQDFILDPERTAPPHAALFAINMLVGTEAGSTYTEAEYVSWLEAAGLVRVRRIRLAGPADLVVGERS